MNEGHSGDKFEMGSSAELMNVVVMMTQTSKTFGSKLNLYTFIYNIFCIFQKFNFVLVPRKICLYHTA